MSTSTHPTPIYTLPSCFESAQSWDSVTKSLSQHGFETSSLLLDYTNTTQCSDVLKKLDSFKIPPQAVVVTSHVSSFFMLKYLESNAISGLVLINPLPLKHSDRVAQFSEICNLDLSEDTHNKLISTFSYTGWLRGLFGPREEPQVPLPLANPSTDVSQGLRTINAKLLADVLDSANDVNLEPSSIKMLLLSHQTELEYEESFDLEYKRISSDQLVNSNYDKIWTMTDADFTKSVVEEIVEWVE